MKLILPILIAGLLAGCAPQALRMDSLQAAFMDQAAAECRYETADNPGRYNLCMQSKGAMR